MLTFLRWAASELNYSPLYPPYGPLDIFVMLPSVKPHSLRPLGVLNASLMARRPLMCLPCAYLSTYAYTFPALMHCSLKLWLTQTALGPKDPGSGGNLLMSMIRAGSYWDPCA